MDVTAEELYNIIISPKPPVLLAQGRDVSWNGLSEREDEHIVGSMPSEDALLRADEGRFVVFVNGLAPADWLLFHLRLSRAELTRLFDICLRLR